MDKIRDDANHRLTFESTTTKTMPAKKRNSAATRQTVTNPAAIQQERTEILAILLDDAGKDWKPRKKGTTVACHTPHDLTLGTTQHRATTAPAKQSQVSKPSPVTLTPAQQREQQQILSILLDDAGKDWKPRVKGTCVVCGILAESRQAPAQPRKVVVEAKLQLEPRLLLPRPRDQPVPSQSKLQYRA